MNFIKREINRLCTEYKTRDPFELCSALNIIVMKADLGPSTKGFYYSLDGQKYILINISLDAEEQRITCAHELGHAILHPNMNYHFIKDHTFFIPNKFEREADIFAAYLLIPDEALSFNEQGIFEIAEELCVPKELLYLRLEDMACVKL